MLQEEKLQSSVEQFTTERNEENAGKEQLDVGKAGPAQLQPGSSASHTRGYLRRIPSTLF